jgi:cobalt-zinc-cadmium efflux system protein
MPNNTIHHPKQSDNRTYTSTQNSMLIVLLVTSLVMIAEVIGGLLANSLALLSDAGHMVTDILALSLSIIAMKFARKPPTASKTFGFHRLEILAAFFNGLVLLCISFYIFYKAYQRFVHPEEIKGLIMLVIAGIGLLANGVGIVILRKSALKNLNVKSAFFHIVGDTISSGGVIVGGLVILVTRWYIIDSLLGLFIGLLILRGAYSLVKESVDIFLEATPKDIDVEKMLDDLHAIEGVKDIHHLHLWTITSGIYAMSAHVLIKDLLVSRSAQILQQIETLLKSKYNMEHTTIQFETESCGDDIVKDTVS